MQVKETHAYIMKTAKNSTNCLTKKISGIRWSILSASEALYKQDYQAYKEIYFSYLDNLEKERKYVIYRR